MNNTMEISRGCVLLKAKNFKLKTTLCVAVFVFLLSAFSNAAFAYTLSGPVSGSWTVANSPYIIDGDVYVPIGEQLTIQPGVEVRFDGHYKFVVYGTLTADGTTESPVIFTRNRPADDSRGWGIRFVDSNSPNHLSHCIVEYGYADNGIWDSADDDRGGGVAVFASNVTIEDCVIRNNAATTGGGIYIGWGSAAIVRRNIIEDNIAFDSGFNACGGGGMAVASGNIIIENNIIAGNSFTGGDAPNYEGGGGLSLAYYDSTVVVNNTIVGNAAPKGSGIHTFGGFNGLIKNNIIWGNTGSANGEQISVETGYEPGPIPDIDIQYNIIQSPGIVVTYQNYFQNNFSGTNNIASDPLFINTANRDFRLQDNSPVVDSGNAVDAPTHDIEGRVRPYGSGFDIGAYEWSDIQIVFTVTPSAAQHGGISPNTPQTVNYNETASFTITPDTGYHIDTVEGCGGTLSGSTYTTNAINADCIVSPNFAINTYTITTSSDSNGSVSCSLNPVTCSANSICTISPNAGYRISSVTVDGSMQIPAPSSYTFINVTATHSISATFALQSGDPLNHLVDMGDGTIYDTDMQLSWLKDAGAGGMRTWADANTWAASLNAGSGFAGLTGWRLPNADITCNSGSNGSYNCTNSEMGHLYYTELGNAVGGPLNNTGPFTSLLDNFYWSGTDWSEDTSAAWGFVFNGGSQGAFYKSNFIYAWAVRPGARVVPTNHLVDMGDGTIYDTDTQLSWLKDANTVGVNMTWDEAVAWAESLNVGAGFAGLTGWRQPNADPSCIGEYNCTNSEMGHLYYIELGNVEGGPLANTGPFVNLLPGYWSGTEYASDQAGAYNFVFAIGAQSGQNKASTIPAWAVRPGARVLPDTTPDTFAFAAQSDVALNTVITSNSITVSGINAPAPISITGGEYSINGGAFTSVSGTVSNGAMVVVQQTSSWSYSTTTEATLTIGAISGTFSVTTTADPNIIRLTTDPGRDIQAEWNHDDTKIAFRSDRTGLNDIWVMNADGSNQVRLTYNGANNDHPSFNHDSSKIVYSSDISGNSDIWVMNADGTNPVQITYDPAADTTPNFSPDGTKIVFQSNRSGNNDIWVINADGTGQTQLTFDPADETRGDWSPDGTKIAFTVNAGNEDIWIMNADGTNRIQLTTDPVLDRHPSFSPDGSRIVFYSDRDGNSNLYTMNIDGTNQQRLTSNPWDELLPHWSHSGEKIVHTCRIDVNLDICVYTLPDTTPAPFTFTAQTDVGLYTVITSNSITVSGINAPASISVTGGRYSINGGTFISTSGTVSNGDTVRVQRSSSGSYLTTTNVTLTIGGVSGAFSITTIQQPTIQPNNLVDMQDGTIYDTDTQLSWLKDVGTGGLQTWTDANAWVTSLNDGGGFAGLTGWRLPAADPACGFGYNCTNSEMGHLYYTELGNAAGGPLSNIGSFTNLRGLVYWSGTEYASDPTSVWVFVFSNGYQSTGSGRAWAVRPGARSVVYDTTPDPFSFIAQSYVALNTVITSNAITVSGINTPASISITGGAYSINGGPFTSVSGSVSNSDTVTLQQTSSGSYSTTTEATLTIGDVTGTFSVTTMRAANHLVDMGDGTIYDTDTQLSWLKDAGAGGYKTWADANAWAASLNVGGLTGWRLPNADLACARLTDCPTSEMGHLYYSELGNLTGGPMSNVGPFMSLHGVYWTGTEYAPAPPEAWYYSFTFGRQGARPLDSSTTYAWAVRSGTRSVAVIINEFPLPTAGGNPEGITTGPDGNLWFAENGNQIGRITTSGVITEFTVPTTDSYPADITTGPDGNLWFNEFRANKIGQITTSGIISEFTIPSGSVPGDITAGPDGNLWFVERNGKIARMTTSGVITEFIVPTAGSSPRNITAGPDGNLWFTEFSGNKIGRITTAGVITEFAIPTSGSNPRGITAGPDGNLWFVENNSNKIGRMTTTGVITEFSIPTAGSYPNQIAAGPDGNLWFTEKTGNNIGRITTAGVITEFAIPTVGSQPMNITTGPDGNLWFAEQNGNKIGQLLLATVPPPVKPSHLVDMGDGTIYDTDTQLSWLKDAGAGGVKTWDGAVAWAAGLNAGSGFAGLTGWRLPLADPVCGLNFNCTDSEMGHLYYTELGNVALGPLTNTGPFVNVQTFYWSGTEYAPDPSRAWRFGFHRGHQTADAKVNAYNALAVRSGARVVPSNHLVDMQDGSVYDTDKQLSWLKDANTTGTMTWDQAVAWAAGLNAGSGFAGLTGWRLPLADPACGMNYNCANSEMGHLFYAELGNAAGGSLTNAGPFVNVQTFYWSGTEYAPDPSKAWRFGFHRGHQIADAKVNAFNAFAVRPGARTVVSDTTPDSFTFTPQTGVDPNTVVTSNSITVSGINTVVPVSIIGGEYSINGGPFTSAAGAINDGNTVAIRVMSSGSNSTTTSGTLTIGGISGSFSVTTMTLPGAISGQVRNSGGSGIGNVGVYVYDSATSSYLAGGVTDSNGNYTVSGIPAGTCKAWFNSTGTGYASQWYSNKSDLSGADTVSVISMNTTTGIDAVLASGGGISGRVTDSGSGLGIGNVWVYVSNSSGGKSIAGTVTDSNGNYTISGLLAGSYKVEFYGAQAGHEVKWYNNRATSSSGDVISVSATVVTTGIDASLQAMQAFYTVTPVVGPHGTVTPATPQSVPYYSGATFSITPEPGYVASIGGCGAVSPSSSTYRTRPITADCTLNVNFVNITQGVLSWTSKAKIPAARTSPMSGVVNGKIYLISGSTTTGDTDAVMVYDPAFDSWQSMPSVGQKRSYAATVVAGDAIYILGGKDGNSVATNTVIAYNTTDGSTESAGFLLKTARYGASAVALNNKIYVIGGIDGLGGRPNTIEEYDIINGYVREATLPTGLSFPGVTEAGGKIYIFGGSDGSGASGTAYMYNPSAGQPNELSPMPIAISHMVPSPSVTSNGKIYMTGSNSTTVQEYDITSDTWRIVGDFVPTARTGVPAQAVINDHIYMIGGNSSSPTGQINEVASLGQSYYTVTPSIGANGAINPVDQQTVASGNTTSFTITPENGYDIAYVTGCGGSLAGNIYTTGLIAGDCTVQASFIPSQPSIKISPTSHYLDVGQIYLGGSSITRYVTVRNTGKGQLRLGAVTFNGYQGFTVVSDTCSGATLSYSALCSVGFIFAPQLEGVHSTTMTIISNDPNSSSIDVLLTGEGITAPAPQLSISADTIDFGQIGTGSPSASQRVIVKNSGSLDLLIGSLSLTGDPDFVMISDTCSQKVLAAGTSCSVRAIFTPFVQGSRLATLVIPTIDSGNLFGIVTLTGEGVSPQIPIISIAPSPVSFGTTLIGASPNRHITIMNSGSAMLFIGDLQLSGSGDFTVSGDTCSYTVLYPSSYCKIMIKYAPSSTGTASAMITVLSDDPFSPATTVTVEGTGVDLPKPHLTAYPSDIMFYNVEVFRRTANTVTISNTGAGNLVIGQMSKDGTDADEFSVENDACSGRTLSPSASCTFDAVYNPQSSGNKTAAVNLPSNDPDMPLFSIALSGTTSGPDEAWIEATEGVVVKNLTVTDTVAGMPDSGMTTDMALSFTAMNVTGSATFSFTFSSLSSSPVFYKMVNGVSKQLYPANQCIGTTDVSLVDNALTFTMQDNSECDEDLTPGVITDPLVMGTQTGYDLSVSISGSGSVTSSPTGISCGISCSSSFDPGSTVTLSAAPAAGYTFTGWSGDCSGTTNPLDVLMDSAKTCTATFTAIDTTPDPFALTDQTGIALSTTVTSGAITVTGISAPTAISMSTSTGSYSVSTNGGATWSAFSRTTPATVNLNDRVKVRLTSSGTYSTTKDAILNIGGVSDTFSVTTMAVPAKYTLSGTVRKNGTGKSGVTITLSGDKSATTTSQADGSYSFGNLGAGSYTITPSKNNAYGLPMTFSPASYTKALGPDSAGNDFTSVDYTLTVTKSGTTGAVSSLPSGITCGSDCNKTYSANTSVTLSATPGTAGHTVTWGGDGAGCTGGTGTRTCAVTMDTAKTVSVVFAVPVPVLTVATNSTNGYVTGIGINCTTGGAAPHNDCTETKSLNTLVTLTATPGTGHALASGTTASLNWTVTGGTGVCYSYPAINKCTVKMDVAKTVRANFN